MADMLDAAMAPAPSTAPSTGAHDTHDTHDTRASRGSRQRFAPRHMQVILAFAAVYSIWGSTYLAIRFADQSIAPFLMAAARFLVAGGALYLWLRLRGAPRPRAEHWRAAAIMGGLLLVSGNGLLVFAEKTVPSAVAALVIALVPLWMALMLWLRPGGKRPAPLVLVGLALGIVGVALLASQGAEQGSTFTLAGAALCIVGSISWAAGSVYSRNAPVPAVPLLATAMEMLCGGAMLVVVALVTGEGGMLHVQAISLLSALSVGYLIIFGSLIGFSAYTWLLRNVAPTKVATYAYVNPAVAVVLGWAFDNERLTGTTILASLAIIGAVVLTTLARPHGEKAAPEPPEPIDVASDTAAPDVVVTSREG